jgi:hypothetical protein
MAGNSKRINKQDSYSAPEIQVVLNHFVQQKIVIKINER